MMYTNKCHYTLPTAHSVSSEVWTIIPAHLKNILFHEFEPQLVVMVTPF